jgi:hypothetical protein
LQQNRWVKCSSMKNEEIPLKRPPIYSTTQSPLKLPNTLQLLLNKSRCRGCGSGIQIRGLPALFYVVPSARRESRPTTRTLLLAVRFAGLPHMLSTYPFKGPSLVTNAFCHCTTVEFPNTPVTTSSLGTFTLQGTSESSSCLTLFVQDGQLV